MDGRAMTGSGGERIAAEYLRLTGYRIIETNQRIGHLEIDIIAQHEDCLVFVEVRTRRTRAFGDALSSVDSRKISRMRRAAARYLSKGRKAGPFSHLRIDVVGIDISAAEGELNLRHIRGAA